MPRAVEPTAAFERTLLKLAGEVGLLVRDAQEYGGGDGVGLHTHRLAAITQSLVRAANEAGVTLEAAAIKNLAKIGDRWPRERHYPDPPMPGPTRTSAYRAASPSRSSSGRSAVEPTSSNVATASTSVIG